MKNNSSVPFSNKLILQGILLILSGRGIASISFDWQLLVTWCHWHLKEQQLSQHHSNREIILRVRTYESLVRKHIQRECKVSFAFITKHKFPVTRFRTNGWYHAILGVETAKLYFYFTHACHDILGSHRDFQGCVGVNDSCRCVLTRCVTASQRCCQEEVSAGFFSFAYGVQEPKMLTVNTTEEGLGNDDGHIVSVALNINTWS